MAITFPTTLDGAATFPSTIAGTDSRDSPDHAALHDNVDLALLALEAAVGVTGSAVTTSLDYIAKSAPGKTLLTTNGDIIIRAAGVPARLAAGSASQILGVSAGLPSWQPASYVAHSGLGSLTSGDDHTQYAYVNGRLGNGAGNEGQVIIGGTASGSTLVLQSTAHATKGYTRIGNASGVQFSFDETNSRLGLGIGNPQYPFQLLNTQTATGTWIAVDVQFDSTAGATSDSSAIRGTARQVTTGNTSIRALEGQVLRESTASANSTWACELGVHSNKAGNGVSTNVGLFIASSHTGWLAACVRADSAILIQGEDGWARGITYRDTNNSTDLFYVNQLGGAYFADKVGIFHAPVTNIALHVEGNFQSGTSTARVALGGGLQTAESGIAIDYGNLVASTARIESYTQGTGYRNIQIAPSGGNVGIGLATAPTAILHTSGTVKHDGGDVTIRSDVATPAAGSSSARLLFGSTAGFGVYYGSGAPTVSAAQGSIYLRSDGSSTSTRLYVNTNGSTTWTNVVTAA